MRFYSPIRNINVSLSTELYSEICNIVENSYPSEIGGLLAGHYSIDRHTAFVEYIVRPRSIKANSNSFDRNVDGLEEEFKNLERKGVEYLGEWHSHPNGKPDYSSTDLYAMRQIESDDGITITNPLLLIIGTSKRTITNHKLYFYDKGNLIEFNRNMDLKELFSDLQKEMLSSLQIDRSYITHSGTKGSATEAKWITFLRKYLPEKYKVDSAIVVDHDGNVSDQIDIVIYDRFFTPFVFNHDNTLYIPAESVYAVFEVKQELNTSYIEYAGEKIESVRQLKRTSTALINAGKKSGPVSLTPIIGGILTTSCGIQKKTIEASLFKLKHMKGIELGCALEFGSFFVDYQATKDRKSFITSSSEIYDSREASSIQFSKQYNSLFTFFLQLVGYLKQIGTIPAIDVNAYLKAIDEEIDMEL